MPRVALPIPQPARCDVDADWTGREDPQGVSFHLPGPAFHASSKNSAFRVADPDSMVEPNLDLSAPQKTSQEYGWAANVAQWSSRHLRTDCRPTSPSPPPLAMLDSRRRLYLEVELKFPVPNAGMICRATWRGREGVASSHGTASEFYRPKYGLASPSLATGENLIWFGLV